MPHARTHETPRKKTSHKPVAKQPQPTEEMIAEAIAEHCPALHGSEDPLAQAHKAAAAVMALLKPRH